MGEIGPDTLYNAAQTTFDVAIESIEGLHGINRHDLDEEKREVMGATIVYLIAMLELFGQECLAHTGLDVHKAAGNAAGAVSEVLRQTEEPSPIILPNQDNNEPTG